MATRQCSKCGQTKPIEEFPQRKRRRDISRSCRACVNDARNADYAAKRKGIPLTAQEKLVKRREKLQREHGLTLEAYAAMVIQQGGLCAICRQGERQILHGNIKNLAVDHSHVTGKLRELLCQRCNTTLGRVCEDRALLIALVRYLEKHTPQPEYFI